MKVHSTVSVALRDLAKLGITMDLEQARGVWDVFDPLIEERRKRSRDQAATKTDASPPSEAPSAEVHRLYPQDDEGKEDA